MRICVKARPKSKKVYIKKIDSLNYVVAVAEVAEGGIANKAIIASLSNYFKIPQSSIILISGQSFRKKVFELPLSLEELEKYLIDSKQVELF